MADGERDEPERPRQADHQHEQHDERLAQLPKDEEHDEQRDQTGGRGGRRAVAKGGEHLVVRQGRRAGDAGRDAGIVDAQRRDRLPDGGDDVFVVGEVARLTPRLDEHEQELAVARLKVARSLVTGAGEQGPPRRRRRHRRDEALADRRQQRVDEGRIERRRRFVESEVHEAPGESADDLAVHGRDQTRQRRLRRIVLEELAVLLDGVPQAGEPLEGEVQQRASRKCIGVDAIGDAGGAQWGGGEHAREPGGEVFRLLGLLGFDDDDDVVQLAEFPQIPVELLDVDPVRRQQPDRRRLERQHVHRVDERGDRGGERQRHGDRCASGGQAKQRDERATHRSAPRRRTPIDKACQCQRAGRYLI